jgi:chromate transporter
VILDRAAKTWFWLNLKIGALSFGGAGRSLLFHQETVEKNKLVTTEEFRESMTIAQVLPGPNLVNLSVYLGRKIAGTRGSFLGLIALCLPGAILAVPVEVLLQNRPAWVTVALQGCMLGNLAIMSVRGSKGHSARMNAARSASAPLATFAISRAVNCMLSGALSSAIGRALWLGFCVLNATPDVP